MGLDSDSPTYVPVCGTGASTIVPAACVSAGYDSVVGSSTTSSSPVSTTERAFAGLNCLVDQANRAYRASAHCYRMAGCLAYCRVVVVVQRAWDRARSRRAPCARTAASFRSCLARILPLELPLTSGLRTRARRRLAVERPPSSWACQWALPARSRSSSASS
jgi:hypothetical protein